MLRETAELLYQGPWVAERYAAIDAFIETNEADLHPVTREITIKARNFSATDTFKAIYKLADLKRRCGMLIEGVDMLCVPTAPTWYTVAENLADPIGTNSRLGTYTNFVNLMGMCGLTLPTGQQSNGRPASVTFLAPDGGDHFLAGIGEEALAVAGAAVVTPATGELTACFSHVVHAVAPMYRDDGRWRSQLEGTYLAAFDAAASLLALGAS